MRKEELVEELEREAKLPFSFASITSREPFFITLGDEVVWYTVISICYENANEYPIRTAVHGRAEILRSPDNAAKTVAMLTDWAKRCFDNEGYLKPEAVERISADLRK